MNPYTLGFITGLLVAIGIIVAVWLLMALFTHVVDIVTNRPPRTILSVPHDIEVSDPELAHALQRRGITVKINEQSHE